jgi:hypothetical protein
LPAGVLENDAITIRTPASMAGGYGAWWIVPKIVSSTAVMPGRG